MEAQYDSRCRSCGEKIYEGDEIYRDDELDAWVCEGCEPAPLRIKKPVTPKKKGPSLADKLGDAAQACREAELAPFAEMDAHGFVTRVWESGRDGKANIDALADDLVKWAVAHGMPDDRRKR